MNLMLLNFNIIFVILNIILNLILGIDKIKYFNINLNLK